VITVAAVAMAAATGAAGAAGAWAWNEITHIHKHMKLLSKRTAELEKRS
jgi:hypothetical protein